MPKVKTREFDPVRYLTDDEIIGEYLTAALEDPNPDVFLDALGDAARAKGMANVAAEAGLGRESLYKALSPGAKPRYDTVLKVLRSLGVKITLLAADQGAQPKSTAKRKRASGRGAPARS
jgi:probable addiction module antidote protein